MKNRNTLPFTRLRDLNDEPEQTAMDRQELFKHLRTLIKVASECDHIETVHRLLKEMRQLLDNAENKKRPDRS